MRGQTDRMNFIICTAVFAGAGSGAIAKHGLRYDVTVIRPGQIGREYENSRPYHPYKPNTEFTYPEVYEVLAGKAHYLCRRNLMKTAWTPS